MRGTRILVVFFLIFTSASLLIPCPMFPGSLLCVAIGRIASQYDGFLGSVVNGLFYGAILWVVFVAISRKLGED